MSELVKVDNAYSTFLLIITRGQGGLRESTSHRALTMVGLRAPSPNQQQCAACYLLIGSVDCAPDSWRSAIAVAVDGTCAN
jgi:hypothetical protein